MNQTRKAILVAALTAMLALPGCQNAAKILQQQQQYVLDVARPESMPAASESRGALKVRRFTIATQYEGYELVYRRSDLVYESDFYNRFFAPPASLVTDKARTWLSDSRIFSHVLDTFSAADFDYTLEASISALYGDYRQKDSPRAVMEIQFTLIDEGRPRNSLVFQKKYSAVQSADAPGAPNLVRALSTCLADILTQLEADMADLLTPAPE